MITAEVLSTWALMNQSASNPLNVTEELVQESLETCPPQEYKGAKFEGRYIIPSSFVRYASDEQTRDKQNDVTAVQNITNDFKVNGVDLIQKPPVVAFDPEHPQTVQGLAGYHRQQVFQNLNQEKYFYDVYMFEEPHAEYNKEVVRNMTNHHKGAHTTQTKHDYIKSVSNSVARGIVPNTFEAITSFVDLICDKPSGTRKSIVREVCASNQTYSNFVTYSSQRTAKNKNSLVSFLKNNAFAPAGIDNRTIEDIQEQGYIVYCAAAGDNQSTWARAITNSVKFDVPVFILGYSDHRVDDLNTYRKEWIEDFNSQKGIMLEFAQNILDDTNADIDEDNFPVKVGGFLPQYVKPNPEDQGAPTEYGVVNVNGETVKFSPDMNCLTM